jgi:site-specific DNA-cytosine methylase
LNVVDLFSCVGCHTLGLRAASPDFRTVIHCERRPYRRRVLSERFPEIPVHPDVRELRGVDVASILDRSLPVLVVGGPPCQNTSVAAAYTGTRTNESLYPEMFRIADELDAEWVVVEQPQGAAIWEHRATEGLRSLGWSVARLEFGASDTGSPYLRRRVFLLACSELRRLEVAVQEAPKQLRIVRDREASRRAAREAQLRSLRVDVEPADRLDGRRRLRDGGVRVERIEALGDSNPPEMMEVIGRCVASAAGLALSPASAPG